MLPVPGPIARFHAIRAAAGLRPAAEPRRLPIDRTLALAAHAAANMSDVDGGLIADAIQAVNDLRPLDPALDDPALDDPIRHGLIHGDLHLNNLWWSEHDGLVLLGLEWVRFGPPSLELQRLCDNADDDVVGGNDTHPSVLRWLAADYPELFAGPDLLARLRLYSMAHAIRQLIIGPGGGDGHRLRRLIDGDWPAPGTLPTDR